MGVTGNPGAQVLTASAGSSTVTATFPAAPNGVNRDLPQYAIPTTNAWHLRDALLNTAGYIRRRGALDVSFSPGAGRCIGLTRCIDPAGTERMAALRDDSTDKLTGFDSGSGLSFSWPTALAHSPYSLFDAKDAQGDGGVLIGTATSPTTGRTLGLWRGGSSAEVSAASLAASVSRGDTTVSLASGGGSSWSAGMFVFKSSQLVGVVKSISTDTLTLEHPALIDAATSVDGVTVRGINPRVTTGTITTDTGSATVNGGATKFQAQALGTGTWDLFTTDFVYIGTVDSVASDVQLTLAANAAVALSNDDYIAVHRDGSYDLDQDQLGFINASFGGHQFYAKGNSILWADLVDPEGIDLTSDGSNLQFSSDPVRALVPGLDVIVSLSENEAYALTGAIGTTPDRWRGDKVHDDGTICTMTALPFQGGVIWAGKRGIWFYDGTTPINLTQALGDDYRNFVVNSTRAWAMIAHNTYFCFIEDGATGIFDELRGSSSSDTGRVCFSIDLTSGAISWHWNLEVRGWIPLPAAVTTGTVLFGVSSSTPSVKVCNGDSLFEDDGQDAVTCEGGPGLGPSLYVETGKWDIGDPQRLKLFKGLMLGYNANGGNLKLDTVVGLNRTGSTATDQYLDTSGDFDEKRVKFMRRSQVCSFRIYESDISGDPTAPSPPAADITRVTLASMGVIYRLKRPGRV